MERKIGLEEHFAIEDTLADSGVFLPDRVWPELSARLLDFHDKRIAYIDTAMRETLACIAEGIDVRSYLYWSLLDNFEWALGYAPTFGLVAVDRQTFVRHPRPSASWLGAVARARSLSDDRVVTT